VERSDVRKTALLVLLVLVLFGLFVGAFPERKGLYSFSLEDPSGAMDVNQMLAVPDGAWADARGRTVNAGYTSSTYWVKARLPSWTDAERLLVINFPLIESVAIYRHQKGGHLTPPHQMGAAYPFGRRPVTSESYVMPLGAADSGATVLVQVRTRSSMQVPLELLTVDEFNANQRRVSLFHGAYLGVVAAMLLYNILLFAVSRERAYVWYLGWMVCMALFVVTVNGMAFQWLWPDLPWLTFKMLPPTLSLAIAFASGFFVYFQREHGRALPGDTWFLALGGVSLGVAVASLAMPFRVGIITAIGLAMLMVTSSVGVAVWRARRGQVPAMYYLMAFSFVITGGVVLALNKFGVIPRTFATEYAAELGSAIEMVVLSFVIIARFNHQRWQREAAQAELIRNQTMRTVELEARVAERTAELEAANGQLLALSQVDALTGVFNRRHLDERLHSELRRMDRTQSSVAVMMVDIDHFKHVNDTHGHQTGDVCLQTIAAALKAGCQRPGDFVARYGGEEFMVVAPDISAAGADTLAEQLRQRAALLAIPVGAGTLTMTVSIGVCWQHSNGSLSEQDMVVAADQALYRAKEAGRNRVVRA
jgi:diguanylate cyclase